MPSILAAGHQGFFMPKQASTIAPQVDALMWFINGVSIFFTVLIFALTIWFAWKYRMSKHPQSEPAGHNNLLEAVWTVIPAILLMVMFFFGFRTYMDMSVQPAAAHEIRVTAFKWGWTFTYRNPVDGSPVIYDKLVLPKGEPVRFILESTDVIHSFFIPVMRMKKDAVPGRFNKYWITPTVLTDGNPFTATSVEEANRIWSEEAFDIYCTEYCGNKHSKMLSKAVVLEPADYRAALIKLGDVYTDPTTQKPLPLAEVGATLYARRGCNACHSVDGTRNIGPTWKDLYGHTGQLVDGSSYVADDDYIRESILYPARKLVAGYGNVMPSYAGQLSDRDIGAMIEYMKTISQYAPKTLGVDPSPATHDAQPGNIGSTPPANPDASPNP